MLLPGQIIRLEPRDTEALGIELSGMLDDLESEYSPYFARVAKWWRWYEAIPRIEGSKDFPFENSSNIVVPFIQIMSDALIARAFSAILGAGKNIWSVDTENEGIRKRVNNVKRHINWGARNDFNMKLAIYDWLSELYPIGSSVIAGNWRNDVRMAFAHQPSGRAGGKIVATPVSYARGPLFEIVPNEQMLWDRDFPVHEAPFVSREFEYSWSWLNHLATVNEGWDKKAVEEVKNLGGDAGGAKAAIKDAKRAHEPRTADLHGSRAPHDVREIHVDWPILNSMGFEEDKIVRPGKEGLGRPSVPLVITLHRRSRKVLWIRAQPYWVPWKPFFAGHFRKRSGVGHGAGVAKRLEHMQSALTTTLNQSIDATTRDLAIWAKTRSRRHLGKPLNPAHPIYDPDGSFEVLKTVTSTQPSAAIMQFIQTIGERQINIFDPAVGRETRQGGHPSPATTTLALLAQTDVMSSPTQEMLRVEIARMGEFAATCYQQFETNEDGKLQRVLGEVDAADAEAFYFPTEPLAGNLSFDVTAMSASTSPEAETQRAVLVEQMNTNYWSRVLQGLQAVENPQVPPKLKLHIIKGIESATALHERFLEAAQVDDIERLLAVIQQQGAQDTQNLRNFAGGLGELAGAAGADTQPAVGGVQGANGRRAPGAAGLLGL